MQNKKCSTSLTVQTMQLNKLGTQNAAPNLFYEIFKKKQKRCSTKYATPFYAAQIMQPKICSKHKQDKYEAKNVVVKYVERKK